MLVILPPASLVPAFDSRREISRTSEHFGET